ncbi:hypothetical protein C8Q74DRAFT_1258695 [Fomes fomentarius]|nr:hypothetical protein C8Q74DRAFT_1258695 [Fomes fomentarius]
MPPKKKTKTTHGRRTLASSKATKGPTTTDSKTTVIRRNVRAKRGVLEGMPDIPLDILFEIFGFLHPRDLLSLARTTKDFRAFLMKRKKTSGGLPNRPAHLSEPAFANLLFSNYCHNCLKTTSSVAPFWKLFTRYCPACRSEFLTADRDATVAQIAQEMRIDMASILNTVYFHAKGSREEKRHYHRSEITDVIQTWANLTTEEEKTKFIAARKDYVNQCCAYEKQLDGWNAQIRRSAIAKTDALREERYQAVLARLRQEGWGDELDKMSSQLLDRLYDINLVSRAIRLTDKGWETTRTPVMEYMEKIRASRLEKEYTATISSRLWTLKSTLDRHQHARWPTNVKDRIYIGTTDCAFMPPVRAIIDDMSNGISKESMETKLAQVLPDLVSQWIEERRSEHIALLIAHFGESDAAKVPEPLELAIAWFNCKYCRHYYRWPQITRHQCFRSNALTRQDDKYTDCVKKTIHSWNGDTTSDRLYTGSSLGISSMIPYARNIIQTCGKDPDTATYAEMEKCGVRLRCCLCATFASQELFDWNAAIDHDVSKHQAKGHPLEGRWEAVSEEHTATARELEAAIMTKQNVNDSQTGSRSAVHCAWCGYSGFGVPNIKDHLRRMHGTEDVKLNVDYYLSHRAVPTIKMYSSLFSQPQCTAEKDEVDAGKAFFATSFK